MTTEAVYNNHRWGSHLESLITLSGLWERQTDTYFRGQTVYGTIHMLVVHTPAGRHGWKFIDESGEIITRVCTSNGKPCSPVIAISFFESKYILHGGM